MHYLIGVSQALRFYDPCGKTWQPAVTVPPGDSMWNYMLSVPSLVRIHFAKCISCWVIEVPLPNCFSADFLLWLNQYLFSVQNFCPALHSSSQVQCGPVLLITNPWIKTGESKQITLEGSRHPHSRRRGHRPEVCSVQSVLFGGENPGLGEGWKGARSVPFAFPCWFTFALKPAEWWSVQGKLGGFLNPQKAGLWIIP